MGCAWSLSDHLGETKYRIGKIVFFEKRGYA